jgi:dephospho-CoA kinase
MLKIGLTGGVCCGKSTALEIFARHGFQTIDLDRHVQETLQGNERVKSGLKKKFGDQCVDSNTGTVLANKLTDLVFQNKGAMVYLENLIYPEIESLWKRESATPSVVEIPLLFENNLHGHFNFSICVYASYATQFARAKVFRGWTKAQLDSRLAQQLPIMDKISLANFVIGNNGTQLQFERQIQQLLRLLEAKAQSRR